jgi:hypothetical protein
VIFKIINKLKVNNYNFKFNDDFKSYITIKSKDRSRVKSGEGPKQRKKNGRGPELKNIYIQPNFFFLGIGGTMATTCPPQSVTD